MVEASANFHSQLPLDGAVRLKERCVPMSCRESAFGRNNTASGTGMRISDELPAGEEDASELAPAPVAAMETSGTLHGLGSPACATAGPSGGLSLSASISRAEVVRASCE